MERKLTITIAGGGSTYTPGILGALLNNQERLPVGELRLYDIDGEKQEKMGALIRQIIDDRSESEMKLVVTTDPETAFKGVDFVFSQIRVGGLEMREKDEKIPLSMGLVGQETCGAGGFAYGLRSVSGILPLVGEIQKYAPEAWILNYTNPESIIAEAIRRKYPGIRMINICDMTIAIEEAIAQSFGYDAKDFSAEYYGLNHFGWWRGLYHRKLKRDIMPEVIERIRNGELKTADFDENDPTWVHTYEMLGEVVRDFPDYIPNTYLQYYLYPDVVVKDMDPEYTRANEVMDGRFKRVYGFAERCWKGEKINTDELGFNVHGEYIVDLATSILNDERRRFKVILPNNGAIPNIRKDAVVEIPAYITSNGPEPISMEPICDFHKGLLENQIAAEKLLLDAYFEHSYQKALQAFTLNRTVPSAYMAKKLLDKFIEVNKDYWPELK